MESSLKAFYLNLRTRRGHEVTNKMEETTLTGQVENSFSSRDEKSQWVQIRRRNCFLYKTTRKWLCFLKDGEIKYLGSVEVKEIKIGTLLIRFLMNLLVAFTHPKDVSCVPLTFLHSASVLGKQETRMR